MTVALTAATYQNTNYPSHFKQSSICTVLTHSDIDRKPLGTPASVVVGQTAISVRLVVATVVVLALAVSRGTVLVPRYSTPCAVGTSKCFATGQNQWTPNLMSL